MESLQGGLCGRRCTLHPRLLATPTPAARPHSIKLERALPFDVALFWRPEIHGGRAAGASAAVRQQSPNHSTDRTARRRTDWSNERYGVKRNETGMADMTIRWGGWGWGWEVWGGAGVRGMADMTIRWGRGAGHGRG
jgi:hypothetical protein